VQGHPSSPQSGQYFGVGTPVLLQKASKKEEEMQWSSRIVAALFYNQT